MQVWRPVWAEAGWELVGDPGKAFEVPGGGSLEQRWSKTELDVVTSLAKPGEMILEGGQHRIDRGVDGAPLLRWDKEGRDAGEDAGVRLRSGNN